MLLPPDSMIWQSATVDVGEAPPVYHPDQEPYIDKTVGISDFARRLSDLLPNPWQAARIASQMRESLRQNGETEEDIYDRHSYLVHTLREHIKHEVEQQAEQIFRRKLNQGEIRFDLETGEPNYKLRDKYEIEVRANDRPLTRYGSTVQLSLFEPVNNILITSLKRNLRIILMNVGHYNGGIESLPVNAVSITCRAGNRDVFTPISLRWRTKLGT